MTLRVCGPQAWRRLAWPHKPQGSFQTSASEEPVCSKLVRLLGTVEIFGVGVGSAMKPVSPITTISLVLYLHSSAAHT